ncbi:hypothetical protein AAFC00_003259 [Neodothiora populina]|uniref:RING-type domain-containing protein n=1 Tax=Neodothiora populina TaxID=2781224 RepID=A0ABR3P9U0_9PEZI
MEGGPSHGINPHRQESHGKRSYSQMEAAHRNSQSQSPLFVPQDSTTPDRESPLPVQQRHPHLALPPFRARYAGDGLDFRRPARTMNSNNTSVIDLTDDDDSMPSSSATPVPDAPAQPVRNQRLPRFGREIIDLSAEPASPEPRPAPPLHEEQQPPWRPWEEQQQRQQQTQSQYPPPRSSPEVQFVSERPRSPRSRIQERQATPHPPIHEQEYRFFDLTNDNNDDEVVHVRTLGRPGGINVVPPHGRHSEARQGDFSSGRHAAYITGRARRTGENIGAGGPVGWGFGHFVNLGGGDRAFVADEDEDGDATIIRFASRYPRRPGPGVPMTMDYETIGFGVVDEPPERAPTPKYSPPPEPAPGFTRSPEEDDVLVCPNCEDELGLGKTDQKKQVWVVKACGHVYCGDCMVNRKSKAKGKGKAKITDPVLPRPFNACQVQGCGKQVNKNHVMQIFL